MDLPTPSTLAPGVVVAGNYRLVAQIGQGAMGSVWRAERLDWGAPVAIKLLAPDLGDSEVLGRFEREVRLAATLRSPHVVQVLDHGIDEASGCAFIVMELIEGEPLSRRLRRLPRLSGTETHKVLTHVVRALTRAHAAGVVHRDLKPDNIFLVADDGDWSAKVLDFGVARWIPTALRDALTRPGSLLGTPVYMSPEQIVGRPDIDHRADLWSLCVIACECLSGRRPFDSANFCDLVDLLHDPSRHPLPSSLGPVPRGFDAWFARGTHPDIAQRFQSARELSESLDVILRAPPALHSPKAPGEGLALTTVLEPLNTVLEPFSTLHPPQPASSGRTLLWLGAGGLAFAVGVFVLPLGSKPWRTVAADAVETAVLESTPAPPTGAPKKAEPQSAEALPLEGKGGTAPTMIAPGLGTPEAQAPTRRDRAADANRSAERVPPSPRRPHLNSGRAPQSRPSRTKVDSTHAPHDSAQVEVLGRKVRTTLE